MSDILSITIINMRPYRQISILVTYTVHIVVW